MRVSYHEGLCVSQKVTEINVKETPRISQHDVIIVTVTYTLQLKTRCYTTLV